MEVPKGDREATGVPRHDRSASKRWRGLGGVEEPTPQAPRSTHSNEEASAEGGPIGPPASVGVAVRKNKAQRAALMRAVFGAQGAPSPRLVSIDGAYIVPIGPNEAHARPTRDTGLGCI